MAFEKYIIDTFSASVMTLILVLTHVFYYAHGNFLEFLGDDYPHAHVAGHIHIEFGDLQPLLVLRLQGAL